MPSTSSKTHSQRFNDTVSDLCQVFRASPPSGDSLTSIACRHRMRVEDVGYTDNDHICRELWVSGDMIGFRTTWAGIERLAREIDAAGPDGLAAIREREYRREYPRTRLRRSDPITV